MTTYLIGSQPNADYGSWDAVFSYLAGLGPLSSDYELMLMSDLDYAASGSFYTIDLNGHTIQITSPLNNRGKGGGFITRFTGGVSVGLFLELKNTGTLTMTDQHWTADGAGSQRQLFQARRFDTSTNVQVKMERCIFDGEDETHIGGVYIEDEWIRLQAINCIWARHSQGVNVRAVQFDTDTGTPPTTAPYHVFENCTFYGSDKVFLNQVASGGVRLRNCCFVSNNDIGISATSADESSGNAGDDTDVSAFVGQVNRYDAGIVNQFSTFDVLDGDFLAPNPDSYLYSQGVVPLLLENVESIEGNARPGSDHNFAAGAVNAREILRKHWNTAKKVVIDGSKITVTGTFQFVITEHADGMLEVLAVSKDGGGDIRVTTDRFGYAQVPVEVAQWDKDNLKLMLWVKVAAEAGEDLTLYVWSGNANADHVPNVDTYGQYAVWENFTFVMHGMEAPSGTAGGYAKDSSPGKHYGIFTGVLNSTGWADGLPSSGVGKAYLFESGDYLALPPGDYLNGASGALAHLWAKWQQTTPGTTFKITKNGSKALRLQHEFTITTSHRVSASMPDAGSVGTLDGSAIDTNAHQFGASAEYSPDTHLRTFLDGVQDTATGSVPFTANFDNTDSSSVMIGNSDPVGSHADSWLQEVWIYKGSNRDDAQYLGMWYENIESPSTFFKDATLEIQDGAREFRFATEEGQLDLEATDFYIEFEKNTLGDLIFTLTAVWEAVGMEEDWGLRRRMAVESRLRELAMFINTRGTLYLDTTYPQVFRDVYLTTVESRVVDNNSAVEYSLSFSSAIQGGYALVGRSLRFGMVELVATNFFVEYLAEDRTSFKQVFRAAPIRIESGPTLRTIRIIACIAVSGSGRTVLEARKKAELYVARWSNEYLGTEGELVIDGITEGVCHLSSVGAADLSLPDRVGIDLEFVTGYGS